jgi:hypothetical protein
VKSKGSRRRGTVQKRCLGVVKIESFRGVGRKNFIYAPRRTGPSAQKLLADV